MVAQINRSRTTNHRRNGHSNSHRRNGANGQRSLPIEHRRISWDNSEDFDAVLCLALGITGKTAQKFAGLKGTVGRVYNRGHKAGVSSLDYRNMTPGTIGGDIARMLLEERRKQLESTIRRELKDDMPT